MKQLKRKYVSLDAASPVGLAGYHVTLTCAAAMP